MNQQFSCFIIGEGTLLIQCADVLLQRGHDIYGIITANPAIVNWARQQDITVIHPQDDDVVAALRQQPFDYFFSIANLSIISDEILALPRQYAINFHDGPLPRYAGLNAPAWALMNRETTYGITWHIMGTEVDAGDILKQVLFEVAEGETSFTINARNYEIAAESFAELVDELANGTVQPVKQTQEGKSYFGKFKRPAAAGIFSFDQDAEDIAAFVRALDFGVPERYTNPLLLPKLVIGGTVYLVPEIEVTDDDSTDEPGTVIEVNGGLQVATRTRDVIFPRLLNADGQPVSDLSAVIIEGERIADLDAQTAEQLTALNKIICKHEDFWLNRLSKLEPGEPPYAHHDPDYRGALSYESLEMPLDGTQTADFVTAAFGDYLARINNASTFDIGFRDTALKRELMGAEGFFAAHVPLRVNVQPLEDGVQTVLRELEQVRQRKTYARDMIARYPEMKAIRDNGLRYAIVVEQVESFDDYTPLPGSELTLLIAQDGSQCLWVYQTPTLSHESIALMQHQFGAFLRNLAAGQPANAVSLLTPDEFNRIVYQWNDTKTAYPSHLTIPQLFAAQAAITPDAVAAVFQDQEITYDALNRRANQLARHLRALGVKPDTMVGLYMDRSLDMIVALIGIHKAGGAYLPLDPTYPAERIAFMVEDSQVPVLLTQSRLVKRLPKHNAHVVCIDSDWPTIAREENTNFDSGVQPHNLAYVIYTSGSTGKPKGVMIEHRNVVNFFTGMDARLGSEPGTWLAVTSLSFDISVLELFWTLTRGFKVVIYAEDRGGTSDGQEIDFSLFYFASDEGENVADRYELLLEGAKYGDKHGFLAVWTPERHFYAFGGLYPNPSVASAAIAAITERIQIRSGSVVLPLHSPIRVAEEWALVDNLSKGRVGISFAAGWQPNDFVLRPENFPDRKNIMFRDIEVVRRLWRGETVMFPGPNGKEYPVRTLPRPIQEDLPSWVTIAGNPETFQMAGEGGFRILTHLLGQSVEELSEKLEIYRKAWRDAGHPGNGYVTLMLHTFVGEDDDEVREIVRQPMINYLRDALDLTEKAAWSFPAFKQRAEATGMSLRQMFEKQTLSDEEKAAVLNHAFERYFETSGLFGTVETCLKMVDKLKAMHIDEIGCLIDFGVPSKTVMPHLEHLNELRERANMPAPKGDFSLQAQVEQQGVTHLQCTPSMASMLLMNEDTRSAFRKLRKLMIGGEAFPVALAQELRQIVPGDIINMYGPTETTIWSSTYQLDGHTDVVPIGTPIANTQLYVLDRCLQPVPVGVVGELYIGGLGVVRGYFNRPELTAQRFIQDPFVDGGRMYRTGDLARYLPDGTVEFLGRNDFQVKIRGYRIELGEIEKLLDQHPVIAQSVVIAREDVPGDKRLVAYYIAYAGQTVEAADLRDHLRADLPDFMIPSHFVSMPAFPLTPNLKVDRKALPAPGQAEVETENVYVAPQSDLEEKIAAIWREVLNVPNVGVNDNFFDLGGHSLLTVEAHRRLKQVVETDLTVTDLFRFTTIRSLVNHLSPSDGENGQARLQKSLSRADRRKQVRGRR